MKALVTPINIDHCKHITLEQIERKEQRICNRFIKIQIKKLSSSHTPLLFYLNNMKTFIEAK